MESLRREVLPFMITREETVLLLKALEGNAELEILATRLKAQWAQFEQMNAMPKNVSTF